MNTKTKLLILAMAVTAAGLLTCSGPSAPELAEPEYNNPYDERGDAYIHTPDIKTAPVTGVRALQAESGGEFETDYGKPVTAKGVCWSIEEEPTVENDCTNDGQGHGAFVSVMTGLQHDQVYYVRAYATNEDSTGYGGQLSLTTRDGIPVLATIEPFDVKAFSAKTGGDITDDGEANITDRGVCYSTVHTNPTMQDECISAGSGTGSFEITLSHLESITKYHLRAYAQNEISTGYGSSQSFRTNAAPVEDIDGNAYPIVEIGDQIWMAENLRTTRYQNGQTISTGLNNTDWENSTSGAYAVYPHENISGLYSEAELIGAYGKLYNWHSVNDNRGLCPSGWRIPSNDDWTQLVNFVVSQGYPNTNVRDGAANALKSRRQDDSPLGVPWATSEHPRWNFSVRYGIDVFSFSGLPGGYRTHQGSFGDLGSHGSWWSSSESSTANAWRWRMSNDSGNVGRIELNKRFGLSVRCLRD